MKNDLTTQLLLLLAGALAGIVSGIVGSAYKNYLDRKSELQKSETAVRLQYLYPLLFASAELKRKLLLAYDVVSKENNVKKPEPEMTDRYYLRHWFWKCKEYIVNPDSNWSDEQRKRELAMHSGGIGYDAASTLFVTAYYLWHARRTPKIPSELQGKSVDLVNRIKSVRDSLGGLGFYEITQDSIGDSMTNRAGEVMNYREFCVAITDQSQRAWFLRLADVYLQLHDQSQNDVQKVIGSLENLSTFLAETMKAAEPVGQTHPI
jgi:hypothetical protein